MLPRSCLRLADSKSNSSTFCPRTATTRVSSGWEASISILLAMLNSRHGDRGQRLEHGPRERRPSLSQKTAAGADCSGIAFDRHRAPWDALWLRMLKEEDRPYGGRRGDRAYGTAPIRQSEPTSPAQPSNNSPFEIDVPTRGGHRQIWRNPPFDTVRRPAFGVAERLERSTQPSPETFRQIRPRRTGPDHYRAIVSFGKMERHCDPFATLRSCNRGRPLRQGPETSC